MKNQNKLIIIAFTFIGIGVVFFIIPLLLSPEILFCFSWKLTTLSNLSMLGSYYAGTSGVFFSLASIMFIYITILKTNESLKLQEKVLSEDNIKHKNDVTDSKIFNMINLLDSIKNDNRDGKKGFLKDIEKIARDYPPENNNELKKLVDNGELRKQLEEEYFSEKLVPYATFLHCIVKYITDNVELKENQDYYIELLSSLITTYELRALQLGIISKIFSDEISKDIVKLHYRYYIENKEKSKRTLIQEDTDNFFKMMIGIDYINKLQNNT